MDWYVHVNNPNSIRLNGLEDRLKPIDVHKIRAKLCAESFEVSHLVGAIQESEFCVYVESGDEVVAVATLVFYGTMWEISHICSAKKGSGTVLINAIKFIAHQNLPVQLMGLGVYPGSRILYKNNGFVGSEHEGFTFNVTGGRKSRRRKSRPRKSRKGFNGFF